MAALDAEGVVYTVDETLVRGLDNYTGAVWEFETDRLGAQAAVLAGGRYDGLAAALGDRQRTPAVGWAAGPRPHPLHVRAPRTSITISRVLACVL